MALRLRSILIEHKLFIAASKFPFEGWDVAGAILAWHEWPETEKQFPLQMTIRRNWPRDGKDEDRQLWIQAGRTQG